jgi:transcriptional regulator with XRE-family HTH domain
MPPVERLCHRGARRGAKALVDIAEEFRHARLRLGLSQQAVAQAARIDRADYSRIEAGKLTRVALLTLFRVGAVLGLDLSLRAYPGGWALRDAGQAKREQRLIAAVGPPLRWQTEVPITREGSRYDLRGWDLVISGRGERTGFEFEVKLYDLQAQHRRWNLKRRDDPVEHFVVAVAETRANRRVLAEFTALLTDRPRHRTATVLGTLRRGDHPPTGIVLI